MSGEEFEEFISSIRISCDRDVSEVSRVSSSWQHPADAASEPRDLVMGFVEFHVKSRDSRVAAIGDCARRDEGLVVVPVVSREEGYDVGPEVRAMVFKSTSVIDDVALCDVVGGVEPDDICRANGL